jgi:predicted oxidoreductase
MPTASLLDMTNPSISYDDGRRRLGATDLFVSPLAWGMWRFRGDDLAAATGLVETALDIGINLFDTADIYGPDNGEPFGAAETLLGRVLARSPTFRGAMVLATKGGIEMGVPYNSSADYLISACEASLRRLGVERIDLYKIHRPDSLAHPAEVAGALERLRASGKIAEVGVSNHTPAQVAALAAHLPFKLAAIQPEFSALSIAPLYDGVLDQAMEMNLGVLAWSPLSGGRLAGDSADGQSPAVREALDGLASAHDTSRAAVAYAWIMAHPAKPIPIIGSQTPGRIREAADALKIHLSRTEWYSVLTAARGAPLP